MELLFFLRHCFLAFSILAFFDEESGSISQIDHWDETEEYGSRSECSERKKGRQSMTEREEGG